jgi:hypothetical protein
VVAVRRPASTQPASVPRSLGDRLGGDLLPDSLPGAVRVRLLLIAMLGIGTLGAAVPAVEALLVRLWVRRTYGAGAA